jgi:hypothetical protein
MSDMYTNFECATISTLLATSMDDLHDAFFIVQLCYPSSITIARR